MTFKVISNTRALSTTHKDYPQRLLRRLGEKVPPSLTVKGNVALFNHPAVAFAGNRDALKESLEMTEACVNGLVHHGINIVSGYARGVDLAAHSSALRAGGTTTMVLSEGIDFFKVNPEIGRRLRDDNVLVLSEFPTNSPWTVGQAMQRNATICGLADALVIVQAKTYGGTFHAGKTALSLNLPLFVVADLRILSVAKGNQYFLDRGAEPIRLDGNGSPNLGRLIATVLF